MQAVLFGGTGLTGSCILDLLNNDPDFKSIIVVTRNIFTHSSNKISNKVIDFSDPAEIESCIKQDSIVFSCIGTCLLYTSPSPRDKRQSRMPSSA